LGYFSAAIAPNWYIVGPPPSGVRPPVFWLPRHNHTSAIGHFNTAEGGLGRALLDFVANPR